MKWIEAVCRATAVLLLLTQGAAAELRARTSDGREVVLGDDGRWRWVEEQEKTANQQITGVYDGEESRIALRVCEPQEAPPPKGSLEEQMALQMFGFSEFLMPQQFIISITNKSDKRLLKTNMVRFVYTEATGEGSYIARDGFSVEDDFQNDLGLVFFFPSEDRALQPQQTIDVKLSTQHDAVAASGGVTLTIPIGAFGNTSEVRVHCSFNLSQ